MSGSLPERLRERYALFLLRRRGPVLGVWVVATLVLALLAGRLEFDFSFVTLFESRGGEMERFLEYRDTFGDDASNLFVVVQSDHLFTPEVLKWIEEAGQSAAGVEGVRGVTHLLNVKVPVAKKDGFEIQPLSRGSPKTADGAAALARTVSQYPFLEGELVSSDRTMTVMLVELENDADLASERERVIREVEERVAALAAGKPIETFVTGIPVVQQGYKDLVFEDQARFVPAAVILLLIISYAFLRRALWVVIALLPVSVSVVWLLGLMSLAGQGVNIINQVIPTTIMVIGIADAIHIILRFREEMERGKSREEAIRASVVALSRACFLTSLTTAMGFWSLLGAHTRVIRDLGIFAGSGVILAYLNTMVLVPALLSFGRNHLLSSAGASAPSPSPPRRALDSVLARVASTVLSRPRAILGAIAVLTLGSAWAATRLESHHYLLEEIMEDDPLSVQMRLVEKHMSGLLSFAVVIEGENPDAVLDPAILRVVEGAEKLMKEREPVFISRTNSLVGLVKEIHARMNGGDPAHYRLPEEKNLLYQYLLFVDPDVLRPFTDESFQKLAIRVRGKDVGSERWLRLKPVVAEYLKKELPSGFTVHMTGTSDVAITGLTYIVRDMMVSLSWSFVMIFAVIMVLFRSVRIGLISVIPNVLPLVATLGLMGLVGIPMRTASVFIFTVSLGIAVDDTIHFIARWLEERKGGLGPREAAERTMGTSGRAMVATTVILVAGFAVFFFSRFKAVRDFGIFGGFALLVALALDLTLTPLLFTRYYRRS
ncbi:MAG: RND family transporter [Nitrospirae bacterium]|nr:RND family transporter [Nitrospirota bacterium]